jgi:superoxide reductase
MTKIEQVYKCAVCGNIVEVLHAGAGELVCCGQPMDLMAENSIDAAVEKHVPVIEEKSGLSAVKVGSDEHPMTEEHHIEWIEIKTEDKLCRQALKPGEKPTADFPIEPSKIIRARAYCNLHGLWASK